MTSAANRFRASGDTTSAGRRSGTNTSRVDVCGRAGTGADAGDAASVRSGLPQRSTGYRGLAVPMTGASPEGLPGARRFPKPDFASDQCPHDVRLLGEKRATTSGYRP
jgi:hypothetical protein